MDKSINETENETLKKIDIDNKFIRTTTVLPLFS